MKLVICEKPSVGAAVAAALGVTGRKDGYIEGNGYLISWCIGHLVQLSEAAAYGEQYKKWSYDSLPILPQEWQYTVAADKGKQFKILKDLMHRADVTESTRLSFINRHKRASCVFLSFGTSYFQFSGRIGRSSYRHLAYCSL